MTDEPWTVVASYDRGRVRIEIDVMAPTREHARHEAGLLLRERLGWTWLPDPTMPLVVLHRDRRKAPRPRPPLLRRLPGHLARWDGDEPPEPAA
jgi:hypothetical protein